MTLPASFPMSMSDIATELGLSLPLSINHAWVIALAGKTVLPVSFSDLLGKTASFNGNVTGSGTGSQKKVDWYYPAHQVFFDGQIISLYDIDGDGSNIELAFNVLPTLYTGNILVTNVTSGVNAVLVPPSGGSAWTGSGGGGLLVPANGVTQHLTIYPHT